MDALNCHCIITRCTKTGMLYKFEEINEKSNALYNMVHYVCKCKHLQACACDVCTSSER